MALLDDVIDASGGLARWNSLNRFTLHLSVGGMLFSTILNLIFIPVLYVILKTLLASLSRKKSEVGSETLQIS